MFASLQNLIQEKLKEVATEFVKENLLEIKTTIKVSVDSVKVDTKEKNEEPDKQG